MGDLKTPWMNAGDQKPVLTDVNSAGDSIISRGTDPNVTLDGDSALDPLWAAPVVPTPGGEETPNSVSGLPAEPNRFEPSDTPPQPPDLTDRNPGTIDQK